MKEYIYKDLYDNHIKKYEELLEKNVITEYEFNKIKKDIYQKEELTQKNIDDSERKNITNKRIERLTLKELVLSVIKLLSIAFKITASVFSLFTAFIFEPYGIYTILFFMCSILLLPFVQNRIVMENDGIKTSTITIICIFLYFIVSVWCMFNLI